MESEIKLAWKQGYRQALVDWSSLDREIMEKLAEDSWKAVHAVITMMRREGSKGEGSKHE